MIDAANPPAERPVFITAAYREAQRTLEILQNEAIVRRLLTLVGYCGHEAAMVVQEEKRLYLRCPECGRVSPGWVLDVPDPRRSM